LNQQLEAIQLFLHDWHYQINQDKLIFFVFVLHNKMIEKLLKVKKKNTKLAYKGLFVFSFSFV